MKALAKEKSPQMMIFNEAGPSEKLEGLIKTRDLEMGQLSTKEQRDLIREQRAGLETVLSNHNRKVSFLLKCILSNEKQLGKLKLGEVVTIHFFNVSQEPTIKHIDTEAKREYVHGLLQDHIDLMKQSLKAERENLPEDEVNQLTDKLYKLMYEERDLNHALIDLKNRNPTADYNLILDEYVAILKNTRDLDHSNIFLEKATKTSKQEWQKILTNSYTIDLLCKKLTKKYNYYNKRKDNNGKVSDKIKEAKDFWGKALEFWNEKHNRSLTKEKGKMMQLLEIDYDKLDRKTGTKKKNLSEQEKEKKENKEEKIKLCKSCDLHQIYKQGYCQDCYFMLGEDD